MATDNDDVGVKPSETAWAYLGDGLYAWFDGYQIVLRANDHREGPTVYVDRAAWANLKGYTKQFFGG
jgi:hypothetical protein